MPMQVPPLLSIYSLSRPDLGGDSIKILSTAQISVLPLIPVKLYRKSLANVRSDGRIPPFQAFRAVLAFPSTVRGPVECVQGCQARIACLCCPRRAGVQPFAIALLQ